MKTARNLNLILINQQTENGNLRGNANLKIRNKGTLIFDILKAIMTDKTDSNSILMEMRMMMKILI